MATAAAVYSDNGRDGDCRTRGLYCLGSDRRPPSAASRQERRTTLRPHTALMLRLHPAESKLCMARDFRLAPGCQHICPLAPPIAGSQYSKEKEESQKASAHVEPAGPTSENS